MISCSRCHKDYPIGTLFCLGCGENLAEAPVATDPSRVATDPQSPASRPLMLYLPASRRSVEVRASPQATLGRADPRAGTIPDVDLTPDDGLQVGVSRIHAAIRLENGQFAIVDLHSANGTFHNGRQLVPQNASVLADGDEVRLGGLVLRVYM